MTRPYPTRWRTSGFLGGYPSVPRLPRRAHRSSQTNSHRPWSEDVPMKFVTTFWWKSRDNDHEIGPRNITNHQGNMITITHHFSLKGNGWNGIVPFHSPIIFGRKNPEAPEASAHGDEKILMATTWFQPAFWSKQNGCWAKASCDFKPLLWWFKPCFFCWPKSCFCWSTPCVLQCKALLFDCCKAPV